MILSDVEDLLAREILSGKYSGQIKTLNLKRVTSFINKLKQPTTKTDVLVNDLRTLDICKFMDDIIETLIMEFKLQDASKMFLLYIILSRDYVDFNTFLMRRMKENITEKTDAAKLKFFLKFLYICDEYNVESIEMNLIFSIYNIISRYLPNDFLNFLGFIHKNISLSSNSDVVVACFYKHFGEISEKIFATITTKSIQINSQLNRIRSTFENRGDISASTTSEFLSIYNELDLMTAIYLKLGGLKDKISPIDLRDIIIEDGKRLKLLEADGYSNQFDSKEEELFYTLTPFVECSSEIFIFDEEIFKNKILGMNSAEDADIAYSYTKGSLSTSSTTILECLMKCSRSSNERIPLICRAITRLALDDSSFADSTRDYVFNQAVSLLRLKHSVPGLRYRICTVLCEMTKFGIFEVGTLYRYLFMCCDIFDGNSVEMICVILENCGRFLISRKDDKRLDNLIGVLRSKSRDPKKPSNFYKIVHILSFFDGSDSREILPSADSLQLIEKFLGCIDLGYISDDAFHVLLSINSYIESLSLEHLDNFLNAIRAFNNSQKTAFLENTLEYFLYLTDIKNFQACFSLVGLFEKLCPEVYKYEIMLGFFEDFLSSSCQKHSDKFWLNAILDDVYNRIFAASPFNNTVKPVFLVNNDKVSKIATVGHSKQVSTKSNNTMLWEKEFEEIYSGTIKSDLSQCLNKRPVKKKLPDFEKLKSDTASSGLIIITSTKKKPRDLP